MLEKDLKWNISLQAKNYTIALNKYQICLKCHNKQEFPLKKFI